MNLVILTTDDAIGDNRYRFTDNRADHIRSILKLTTGDSIEVGLLDGPSGTAIIETCDDNMVTIHNIKFTEEPEQLPVVDIVCALPRPQTLKKILITSAMMGVRRLYLVRANRVEKSYFHSPMMQPENQRPYLLEGLSQGKLTRMPQVTIHDRFRTYFEDSLPTIESQSLSDNQQVPLKLLPDGTGRKNLSQCFDNSPNLPVLFAIGPEGGWVPFEIELMEGIGFQKFSLGRWTLRVEHALTAVLSQLELLRMNNS